MNRAALWRYFTGVYRPPIDRLPSLCRDLQVSLDDLLESLSVDFNHDKLN